ncbi:MAG: SOS response-associated peptidase [Planctomycetota bacterium]
MCGRYTLKTPPDQWGQLLLPIVESANAATPEGEAALDWRPRYNIAPTQNVLALTSSAEGDWILDYYRWGLVPSWAQELAIGNRMINARAETLPEKRSFSGPLKKRRCMILADGYYEWQKLGDGTKQACWISPQDDQVICLAGLWESNRRATGEEVYSCTIITTSANGFLSPIHDRMPVVLEGQAAEQWMDSDCPADEAHQLLGTTEDEFFKVTRVSKLVNNPRNEVPECLLPMGDASQ